MVDAKEDQTCPVCGSCLIYFSESDDDEEDKTNRENAEEQGICETCWLERVCHICGFVGKFADYYFCEICKKHTVGECSCIAGAQYHGVTCLRCFTEGSLFCDRCGKDIVDFIKSTDASVCTGTLRTRESAARGFSAESVSPLFEYFCHACSIFLTQL